MSADVLLDNLDHLKRKTIANFVLKSSNCKSCFVIADHNIKSDLDHLAGGNYRQHFNSYQIKLFAHASSDERPSKQ